MRSNHSRWRTALIAGAAATGLLVAAPVAAQAAHTSAAAKAHPHGFFVTGAGQATTSSNPSAFLRDLHGGLHVLTTVRSPSASGDRGQIVYSTKKPGAKHWVTHAVPGLRPLAGGVQVEEHLTNNGTELFAVFYECDGVFVTDAKVTTTRLPEPTLAQATHNCSTAKSTVKAGSPPIAKAISVPFGNTSIGILLRDPANHNAATVFIGGVAGTFAPYTTLPTTDHFNPVMLSNHPASDYMTVVGTGRAGGVLGIYSTTDSLFDSGWTPLTLLATLDSPTRDYTIESLDTGRTSAWVGLQRPLNKHGVTKHTLYIDHGTHLYSSGRWTGAFPLPHSTGRDGGLVLTINVATSHPHAAFTRVNTASKAKKSGIMFEDLLGAGGWSKPKFLTHWYLDHADQMAITSTAKTIIGYDQR
jgi:hypothetical protein